LEKIKVYLGYVALWHMQNFSNVRVDCVLDKSLKMLEFGVKNPRPLKVLIKSLNCKQCRNCTVLENSFNRKMWH